MISALCAAFAGILATANIHNADPMSNGQYMELDAIFAVVVGGTALTGGRFNFLGTYFAALMLITLSVTMVFVGVDSAVTPVPKAVLIVAVCLMQSETTRRWFRRFKRRAAA